MAIRKADGSVFKLNTQGIQQYDPENVEHELFNSYDQELIEMGGTPLYYYDVFIDINMIDELYLEARSKIYNETPVIIYGYYDPGPVSNSIGTFMIDSADEVMFELNYQNTLQTLGGLPKVGARIFAPQRGENWRVIQNGTQFYNLWGQLRLQVMCERFQESLTTHGGRVTNKKPDLNVNTSRGFN